jgi:hypothetical protein
MLENVHVLPDLPFFTMNTAAILQEAHGYSRTDTPLTSVPQTPPQKEHTIHQTD